MALKAHGGGPLGALGLQRSPSQGAPICHMNLEARFHGAAGASLGLLLVEWGVYGWVSIGLYKV